MSLRIASRLTLDDSYITKVAAIVAQRRKGKTYTASVLAEEHVNNGLPFVAVDPTGAWWGLRAAADGKKAGLPVTILGGQHGDVTIDRHSGAVVADLVLDHPSWYVCDLSLFDSHEGERTFVKALVERLYRRKAQPGMDFPLHVFIDEADLYAPEQPLPGDQPMLGAVKTMVKRGGLRGIGVTVITQRPASLSKHVLEQADLLVLLRLVGPNDRAAVDRYIKDNAEPGQREEMMRSLPSMKLGEAWVWEPGAEPPLFERCQIRQRKTFNSSATPEPGQQTVEPSVLADVDLAAVKETLAEIIDRAEANNPEQLRARIADLERQLHNVQAAESTEILERLAAPSEWVDARYAAENALVETIGKTSEAHADVMAAVSAAFDEIGQSLEQIRTNLRDGFNAVGNLVMKPASEFPSDGMNPNRTRRVEPDLMAEQHDAAVSDARARRRADSISPAPVDVPRGGVEFVRSDGYDMVLLDVLAWFKKIGVDSVERPLLAMFAQVSSKSSSYSKALARLLNDDLIEYPQPGYVSITVAGARRATAQSPIETNEQLHAELCHRLPSGQSKIIAALTTMARSTITRDALADRAGLSPTSSQYGKDLAALRSMGLLSYPSPGVIEPVVAHLWPLS